MLGPGTACRAEGLAFVLISLLIFVFNGEEQKTGDNRRAVVWFGKHDK